MIFVQPEQRIADEEIAHLVPAKIENERTPILLFALAWVHVLVEIGAVELREGVSIFREMGWHPIHNHADAGLVARVDEVTQFVWRAEAAAGRIIIGDLITP